MQKKDKKMNKNCIEMELNEFIEILNKTENIRNWKKKIKREKKNTKYDTQKNDKYRVTAKHSQKNNNKNPFCWLMKICYNINYTKKENMNHCIHSQINWDQNIHKILIIKIHSIS